MTERIFKLPMTSWNENLISIREGSVVIVARTQGYPAGFEVPSVVHHSYQEWRRPRSTIVPTIKVIFERP
jgi:hypothetical protein